MSGRSSSTSDRDSALVDALLKLNAAQGQQHRHRQQQQLQQQLQQPQHQRNLPNRSNTGCSHPQDATMMSSSLHGGGNPHAMSIPGLPSSYSSALGLHPTLLGLLQPPIESSQQTNYFASQLAAASAPLLPASPVTSLSQQIQAMQQAAARMSSNNSSSNSSSITLPAAPTSVTEHPAANQQKSAGSPLIVTKCTPSSTSSPVSKDEITQSRSSSTLTVPATAAVRPEKVEAALRSKPQRGKRREDLSETERMELTRTRNREHAKSTRLRKKARYQELLDAEEELSQCRQAQTLRQERISTLQNFLLVREAMLNDTSKEDAFATASPSSSALVPAGFLELVENLGTFQFEVHGQKSMASNVSSASLQHQSDHRRQLALLQMKRWDGDVRARFQSVVSSKKEEGGDATSKSSFQYKVLDGPSGVAISDTGNGFARVDLQLKQGGQASNTGGDTKLVLTGILTVEFASTSSRLSSAIWTTTQYAPSFSLESSGSNVAGVAAETGAHQNDDPSSSSNDSLEHQVIHPSVVSLEIKASCTDTTESVGPGMSI